jgi:hypothetical protein
VQARINISVTPAGQGATIYHMVGARKPSTPATYRKQFIDRLRSLRVASGLTPDEIAQRLGVRMDTYQRWEKRTLIPHHLIMPFCDATQADPYLLLTGSPFQLGRVLPFPKNASTKQ